MYGFFSLVWVRSQMLIFRQFNGIFSLADLRHDTGVKLKFRKVRCRPNGRAYMGVKAGESSPVPAAGLGAAFRDCPLGRGVRLHRNEL
jgi:hypothetical protein